MKYSILYFLLLIILGSSCNALRVVEPLQKGEHQIGAAAGGPLIDFAGTVIPVPFSSLHYAYGVSDQTSLHGGLQLTSLGYGTLQMDLGLTYGLLKPMGWKPGLSGTLTANFLMDFWAYNTSLYPEINAQAYWHLTPKKHLLYLGSTNWLELRKMRAHDISQESRLLSGLTVGYTHKFEKWNIGIESKWLAPTRDNQDLTVSYRSIASLGATGIYLTLIRKIK